ncbi:hypothetical protein ACFL5O_12240, partial [Myxococcota bacterium]
GHMRFSSSWSVPASMVIALGSTGCGGSAAVSSRTPADESGEHGPNEESKSEEGYDSDRAADSPGVPSECAGSGEVCTPPGKFVNKVCADAFPGLALYMFQKGSPWTRGYLTRKTEAVNASGGKSGEGYLAFDEEVLVMRKRAADYGGMQVSGAMGGWDVLRWDGTCATLAGEELTLNVPPSPKAAKVDFRFLDANVKEALREDAALTEAYRGRRRECKGATMGAVSKKCEDYDRKLAQTIVDVVRQGQVIPLPEKLP